ncbi:unnamed protein product [Didymodactylos carnosus]|uniref:PARP catalytic domain-containing protein n=1 Tax=Didymodactylos carnosus TaxID=1234261 RepID=A0A815D5E6_9BILA|nr:unnamed protein product [Didymodactylos carnosus]CAF1289030.1 unnamed protein product [Didymodactylos carnosus]CAF3622937.1 unnamed protein product [Didymodactylos carnosus]CAF4093344.1 unnamed protein product [Didymodactylos carnosus]
MTSGRFQKGARKLMAMQTAVKAFKPEKKHDVDVPALKKKFLVLSYHDEVEEIIITFADLLCEYNIPVKLLVDLTQRQEWKILDDTAVICCFLSARYQNSPACKNQLEYASMAGAAVVPFQMSKKWKPTGWLSSITDGRKTIDFSEIKKTNIVSKTVELIYELRTIVGKKLDFGGFEGDFNCPIPLEELQESTYGGKFIILRKDFGDSHNKVLRMVHEWLGYLPVGYNIEKIEVVFNSNRYRMFEGQLMSAEHRQEQAAFQPNLSIEDSQEERQNVLDKLYDLAKKVQHNRRVRIVRMWHGCKRSILPNLLSDGFATLSILDSGWFGSAMYLTSSAKYATNYSGNHECLVLCYVLILNPFPVVASDAPSTAEPQQFRFYGAGNYKSYQCHYIPVSPSSHGKPSDYRPPAEGTLYAKYDELAVFQQSDILPQIVVYLK